MTEHRVPAQAVTAPRLLRTKLYVPEPLPDLVARPRLISLLNAGLAHPLTLVAAPAGSGKTTLLSSWLAGCGVPVAWVALDERDNDPIQFWSYAVAALQTLWPASGELASAMLRAQSPPPIETILTELLNDLAGLAAEDPAWPGFLLVLDDYHSITSSDIQAGVTFLVDHLGPSMRLVLASRCVPPLQLPRWRARRRLTELHPADLRFSAAEAAEFLARTAGLSLPEGDVAALAALTEGWAAGLQMAALSVRGTGEDAHAILRTFSGQGRYVFDYLAQEVLDRQEPEVQAFLLQTAILDRMCGPLCDAVMGAGAAAVRGAGESANLPRPVALPPAAGSVTRQFPNSQSILEHLERANLFVVPLDGERNWYRYHHLFVGFLRARLAQVMDATQIAALRRRARTWQAAQGLIGEAIAQALAGGDYEAAEDLIATVTELMFERNELTTLAAWLAALPPERLAADARMCLVYAWVLLATNAYDALEGHLSNAERALGSPADGSAASLALPARVRAGLAEICCLRANLGFHRMELPRVLVLSSVARAYLTDDVGAGVFGTREALLCVTAFNVGLALEFTGDITGAAEALAEAVARGQATHNHHIILLALGHLGQVQLVQGQLSRAGESFRLSLRAAASEGIRTSPMAGLAYAGLGTISYERDQLDAAEVELRQGIELSRQWGNWEYMLAGRLGQARVEAARGDLEAAKAQLAAAGDLAEKSPSPLSRMLVEAARARLWARSGGTEEPAVRRWASQVAPSFAASVPFMLEEVGIALARAWIALNEADKALELADRLLAAAEGGRRSGRVIEIEVVRALALHALDQPERAAAALRHGHELADPGGYLRVFSDEFGEAATGAQALSLTPLAVPLRRPAAHDSAPTPAKAGRRPLTMAEPLTARELEVLRLLAEGLGNLAIAGRLVVSLNTVKTHVKSIYSKLGAATRTQALAKAREADLL